jgi:hypothetical protein
MQGKIASLCTSFAKRLPSCLWAWDIVAHLCQLRLYVGTNGLVSGPLPKKRKSCSLSKLFAQRTHRVKAHLLCKNYVVMTKWLGLIHSLALAVAATYFIASPVDRFPPPHPPFSQFAHIFPLLILSLGSNNSF